MEGQRAGGGRRSATTPTAAKKKREWASLGALGRYVSQLMLARGIRSQRELSELLWERAGYEASQQRISKWFTNKAQVDDAFPTALRQTLDLSHEEIVRLAMVFTYGRDERPTLEDL